MKNPFRRRYAAGGHITPRITQTASGGVFITRPGHVNTQRFELVPGRDGTGHAGYVVLLDHQLKFAWPYLTREAARQGVANNRTMAPAGTDRLRTGANGTWARAAHTYARYTGWRP